MSAGVRGRARRPLQQLLQQQMWHKGAGKDGSVARFPLYGPLSQNCLSGNWAPAATGRFKSGRLDFTAEKEKIQRKRRDKDRKKGKMAPDNVTAVRVSAVVLLFILLPLHISSISALMTNISTSACCCDSILKAPMNLIHHLDSGSVYT